MLITMLGQLLADKLARHLTGLCRSLLVAVGGFPGSDELKGEHSRQAERPSYRIVIPRADNVTEKPCSCAATCGLFPTVPTLNYLMCSTCKPK